MADNNTLKLYGYFRSSASWRVRLGLVHKNLSYETVPINLKDGNQKKDDYKAINPSGKVPALRLQDGTTVLTQSTAILEYLEERYPENPMLPPLGSPERTKVRTICQIIACDIHPLQNVGVMYQYAPTDQAKQEEWSREWITRGFVGLEKVLTETSGKYCVGDTITMADYYLVPMVYNAYRYNVDMTQFPKIASLDSALLKEEVFKVTHPLNQADCDLPST